MASHGRRGVPAREGEQRRDEPQCEDQGEQQAPAPQGPVLPPPPPVDYGVFMQGLVQAMQTQAHTQAQLEAQQAHQAQVPVPQAQDHGGPSIMERFKRMSPPSFKGESDQLLAESWLREIEKIFRAITCANDDRVTLATYMQQERDDVCWSSLLRTKFEDGAVEIGWDKFMKDYNAILGLDWLEEHYALVDCRGKKIAFRIPGAGDTTPLEEIVRSDSEREE
ncbi:hypothetical protein Taro_051376 [Colocasia esculenta]|uniref:Uncharacterized protein n=1 Tax=Colocasia esculenta TaxID=4460 RepID=A0A843XGE0_COLES|nr:hypothetical protein [Colocasia esculenta]